MPNLQTITQLHQLAGEVSAADGARAGDYSGRANSAASAAISQGRALLERAGGRAALGTRGVVEKVRFHGSYFSLQKKRCSIKKCQIE